MTDFTLDQPDDRRRINYPKNRKRRLAHDRFWEKVSATLGCWKWLGGKNTAGYGYFWFEGRTVGAHQHAYTEAYGPIPAGQEPDHLCENKGCVNPAHLEAVAHIENVRRGKHRRNPVPARGPRDLSTGRFQ